MQGEFEKMLQFTALGFVDANVVRTYDLLIESVEVFEYFKNKFTLFLPSSGI